jgi:hypothetical protein
MLVSGALNGTPDDGFGEELTIELQDTDGTTHCSFGIDSDEAVVINSPGTSVTGVADAIDPAKSYFVIVKLVAQDSGGSGDQLFVKVFESGEPVTDADLNSDWTLIGDAGADSNALIDRIRISSGFAATWSVDEIRVGESYASVAYAEDTFMPADVSRNYYVNSGDVMVMASQWLESTDCQTYLQSDIDESCRVDLGDYARLASQWLNCNDPTDPINCSSQ